MKIYVFAIGGSGARVLRSLTMLLAAGVELPENTELVPIILDPDQGAGNLTETVEILKRYKRLRDQCVTDVNKLFTFTSAISPLPSQNFLIPLEGVDNAKFRQYIGLDTGMSTASAELVKALFSETNLNLDMKVGFKGNPNIGSIVLGQFVETEVFKSFVHDFSQADGDNRIFIISSIFGGTGASGFPTLLKSLRTQEGGRISKAHIGALSLQPYFAVANNPDSAIDSTTFYAKTRAALSYYGENIIKNNNIDDFYFLGDSSPDVFENNEGGAAQHNDAHFVELAGALSIIDFARRPAIVDDNTRSARMYEFGIESTGNRIGFKNLGRGTEGLLACPLTAFYLMSRYIDKFDLKTSPDAWLRSIQRTLDSNFVEELNLFLSGYERWLREMESIQGRSFAPINLDQDESHLFGCVEGYPVDLGFTKIFSKQNYNLYTDKLNAKAKKERYPDKEGELLNLLSEVSYELCADKIGLP